MATIEILPEDLLLIIFHHLSLEDLCLGARPVCKAWHTLSYDFSLWRNLKLQTKADSLTDDTFLGLLELVQEHVEIIDVSGCERLTDKSFIHENIFCPALQRIHLVGTKVTDRGLRALVDKYQDIEGVTCLNCPGVKRGYSVFQNIHSLGYFSDPYENCYDVPEKAEGVCKVLQKNIGLESVRLVSLTRMEHETVVQKLLKNCIHIRSLELPHCISLQGNLFNKLARELSFLVSLDISDTKVTDDDLASASKSLSGLYRINISECCKITDVGIRELVRKCHALQEVVLNDSDSFSGNVTDVGLKEISARCPDLRKLTLCFCPNVTDHGLQHILHGCPLLSELHISGCMSITDASMRNIWKYCPRIEKITASRCVHLTARSITPILMKCDRLVHLQLTTANYLNRLLHVSPRSRTSSKAEGEPRASTSSDDQTVSLVDASPSEVIMMEPMGEPNVGFAGGKHNKTSNGAVSEVTAFTSTAESTALASAVDSAVGVNAMSLNTTPSLSLVYIDLAHCSTLDDESIVQLSRQCRMLRYVSIRACCRLTDAAVAALATGCTLLQMIDISGGSIVAKSRITDESLKALATSCKNLVMVWARTVPHITNDGILALITHCDTLKRLEVTASPRMNLVEVIDYAKDYRGWCSIQDFKTEFVTPSTKGTFLLKFAPKRVQCANPVIMHWYN